MSRQPARPTLTDEALVLAGCILLAMFAGVVLVAIRLIKG